MKTFFESKEAGEKGRKWIVVDAADQVVGRLASQIALRLRGKHRPEFTRHTDGGDFVVVLNADKIRFTGSKPQKKVYFHHTGYIGGMKEETAEKLLKRKPEEVIRKAVWGMMPKTTLSRHQLTKLKIYRGDAHPHIAQQPQGFAPFAAGK